MIMILIVNMFMFCSGLLANDRVYSTRTENFVKAKRSIVF